MTNPVEQIARRVRRRARHDGADFTADPALAERYTHDEVRSYSERALGGTQPLLRDEAQARRDVLAALTGYGPLQPYLDDPEIEEIWINAPDRVFVARDGRSEQVATSLTSAQVRDLVERMLQSTGRRVDLSSPFVDASLPDGSRLHVAIPDITRAHWAVNIRKFVHRIHDLPRLVELGSFDRRCAEFLRMCVLAGVNILISGATQSGKTTLLGALLSAIRPHERVVTVEETFELAPRVPDLVALQCRQPSLEGTGEVTLRRLIKEALRMRPDRLVVGEVREAESFDLLIALNSGLPGLCTIHANSAAGALLKLSTLPLLAGRNIGSDFVVPTVASCVDLVVHCRTDRHGARHVGEILAPTGAVQAGRLESVPLFRAGPGAPVPTGATPPRLDKFERAGLDPRIILGGAA